MARCERVALTFGEVLCAADGRYRHVYFPLRGFVSLIIPAGTATTLEVGLIGREGMLGATVALGVVQSPLLGLVQGDGEAMRMALADFSAELTRNPALRALVLRYCFVLLRQCAQAAVCSQFHTTPARLARWLLMTHDRAEGGTLHLTQEFLARMLGVRRVGITQAAGELQAAGVIRYHRGEISICDHAALERMSCDCYRRDKRMYQAAFR